MKTRFRPFLRFFLLLLAASLAVLPTACGDPLPEMQLHQVAIVSANCHLLIAGSTVILIDGGTDTDANLSPEPMLEYIAATGIDHIDAHFVTHYHNDHAQQLDDFSRDYGTENTVVYGPSPSLPDRFLPLSNGRYEQITAGQEVDVGPFHVKCVGPKPSPSLTGEINRDSLNLVITYGSIRVIVTGDYMTGYVRETFPDDIRDADILIFPHHGIQNRGGEFAIGEKALALINPDLILLPGRSSSAVNALLKRLQITAEVRSPTFGHVVVLSNGETWEMHDGVEPGEYTYGGK